MSCCRPNPYYVDCVPACTKAHPCPRVCRDAPVCVRGPPGPASPYTPSSFFQAALAQTFAFSSPTLVPFSVVTAGNADFSFDAATGLFVAPVLGFYQFNYTTTVSNGGVVATSSVTVNLTVDGNFLDSTSCTLPLAGVQTLSGSAILQLLPDQQVGLTVTTTNGGTVQGPATIGAPPYPTSFSGFSFF